MQRAGQFLGAVLFHRGDVSESPVSQTITVNKKALGFTTPTGGTVGPMVACPANGALPDYTTTTYFVKSYHAHTRLAGHVRFAWDATNLGDYAAASPNIPKDYASFKNQTLSQNYGSPTASVSPFIGGIGLAADDDSYDWAITKLNGIGSGWLYGAEGLNLVYTKKDANYPDNTVFVDMAAGVSGVNSPRTQFGGISFSESREDGYQKRSPNGTWVTDKTHNTVAVRDGVFNLNAIGNRFWKNLRIVNITDYSLLGITSANSSTIALSNSIIIVFAANHHNTGVDYSSNGNIMSGVATNAAGTGYTLESPEVIAADGTSPYGTGALPLAMINTATGFVTGYRMSLGGSSYSGSPTVSLHTKNGGSGASTGAVSVLPAPETQEAKLATSWTGAHEGWPILAQLAFADFVIDGIDGTKNWSLWELDFTGARVQQIPLTMKTATQVQILLSTGQTVKPTIFYELSC